MAPPAVCAICMEGLLTGKDEFMRDHVAVVWQACGHAFHQVCSDLSIAKQKSNSENEEIGGNPCPTCPTCRTLTPTCVQGTCGSMQCKTPYTRLFLQVDEDDENDLPDPLNPDKPTEALFDLAMVARQAGVDAEELGKALEEARASFEAGEYGCWSRRNVLAMVKKNMEGFMKVVRAVQGKAGMECLETHINHAKTSFDHFLATVALIDMLDDPETTISALRERVHVWETKEMNTATTTAKLRVAEAKIAHWGQEQKRETDELRAQWERERQGLLQDHERQIKIVQDASSSRIDKLQSDLCDAQTSLQGAQTNEYWANSSRQEIIQQNKKLVEELETWKKRAAELEPDLAAVDFKLEPPPTAKLADRSTNFRLGSPAFTIAGNKMTFDDIPEHDELVDQEVIDITKDKPRKRRAVEPLEDHPAPATRTRSRANAPDTTLTEIRRGKMPEQRRRTRASGARDVSESPKPDGRAMRE